MAGARTRSHWIKKEDKLLFASGSSGLYLGSREDVIQPEVLLSVSQSWTVSSVHRLTLCLEKQSLLNVFKMCSFAAFSLYIKLNVSFVPDQMLTNIIINSDMATYIERTAK